MFVPVRATRRANDSEIDVLPSLGSEDVTITVFGGRSIFDNNMLACNARMFDNQVMGRFAQFRHAPDRRDQPERNNTRLVFDLIHAAETPVKRLEQDDERDSDARRQKYRDKEKQPFLRRRGRPRRVRPGNYTGIGTLEIRLFACFLEPRQKRFVQRPACFGLALQCPKLNFTLIHDGYPLFHLTHPARELVFPRPGNRNLVSQALDDLFDLGFDLGLEVRDLRPDVQHLGMLFAEFLRKFRSAPLNLGFLAAQILDQPRTENLRHRFRAAGTLKKTLHLA